MGRPFNFEGHETIELWPGLGTETSKVPWEIRCFLHVSAFAMQQQLWGVITQV